VKKKHLKTSDRQIITLTWEIGVTESNSDVKIFIGSSEIAVSGHAQHKFCRNIDKCSSNHLYIAKISQGKKF